jgi:hypothetical protein
MTSGSSKHFLDLEAGVDEEEEQSDDPNENEEQEELFLHGEC